jgi:hypothetical protein
MHSLSLAANATEPAIRRRIAFLFSVINASISSCRNASST